MSEIKDPDVDVSKYFGVLAVPQSAPLSSLSSIYTTLSQLDFKPVPADTVIEKWKKNGDKNLPLNGPAFAVPTYLFFFTGDSMQGRIAEDMTIRKAFSLMRYCEAVIAVQISRPSVPDWWSHDIKHGPEFAPEKTYVKPTIWTPA